MQFTKAIRAWRLRTPSPYPLPEGKRVKVAKFWVLQREALQNPEFRFLLYGPWEIRKMRICKRFALANPHFRHLFNGYKDNYK
jgi:hypothetical protein